MFALKQSDLRDDKLNLIKQERNFNPNETLCFVVLVSLLFDQHVVPAIPGIFWSKLSASMASSLLTSLFLLSSSFLFIYFI